MDLRTFQQVCLRTEADDHIGQGQRSAGNIRLLHGAIGLATEAGELLDQVKKHVYYGKPLDRANVLEECCDTLWYVVLALDSQGFTLEQAMGTLKDKLEQRYAQRRFTASEAFNRDLQSERAILEAGARLEAYTGSNSETNGRDQEAT